MHTPEILTPRLSGDGDGVHPAAPKTRSPLFPSIGFSGSIGVQRAHDIINAYALAFFDRHLKSQAAALLDGPAEQYPDVRFETRRP